MTRRVRSRTRECPLYLPNVCVSGQAEELGNRRAYRQCGAGLCVDAVLRLECFAHQEGPCLVDPHRQKLALWRHKQRNFIPI